MFTLFLASAFVILIIATCGLILRSLSLTYLLSTFIRGKMNIMTSQVTYPDEKLPFQLIQLPVYNEEPEMVKKLIDSACALDYPRSRMLIQVLDDSDREDISRPILEHVSDTAGKNPELAIHYLHRTERHGYKAGNLNHGLLNAGEMYGESFTRDRDNVIVSIFDADFLIPPKYLLETVHRFTDPKICAVQALLGYQNSDQNLLTRIQSAYLSNLHLVDFAARSLSGHLTTFRGSAGSWRLSVIEKHGGWSSDTQIEDVDLSMAAQLSGSRIVYIDDLVVPSRLPASYSGFKLQQRSWMKGMMEVFRKHFRHILTSPGIRPFQKLMALELFMVLTFQPLFMIAHHLTAIPAYYFLARYGLGDMMNFMALGLAVLLNISHLPFLGKELVRGSGSIVPEPQAKHRQPWTWAASVIVSLGMFPTFTYGIVEGLSGRRIHRESTQKVDPKVKGGPLLPAVHRPVLGRIAVLEFLLSIFSASFALWAIKNGHWGMLLLYGPFAIAYPWMCVRSWKELSVNTASGSKGVQL